MIGVTFEADDRRLRAHLDRLPMQVQAKLLPTIKSLTDELLRNVRAAEPVRTGALRAATRASVQTGPGYILGRVAIGPIPGRGIANVAAAALEYGVHSTFQVKAHQEQLSRVFGRQTAPRLVMVSAHTRRVSIEARRFLRDPFAEIRPIAEAKIRAALADLDSEP